MACVRSGRSWTQHEESGIVTSGSLFLGPLQDLHDTRQLWVFLHSHELYYFICPSRNPPPRILPFEIFAIGSSQSTHKVCYAVSRPRTVRCHQLRCFKNSSNPCSQALSGHVPSCLTLSRSVSGCLAIRYAISGRGSFGLIIFFVPLMLLQPPSTPKHQRLARAPNEFETIAVEQYVHAANRRGRRADGQ